MEQPGTRSLVESYEIIAKKRDTDITSICTRKPAKKPLLNEVYAVCAFFCRETAYIKGLFFHAEEVSGAALYKDALAGLGGFGRRLPPPPHPAPGSVDASGGMGNAWVSSSF